MHNLKTFVLGVMKDYNAVRNTILNIFRILSFTSHFFLLSLHTNMKKMVADTPKVFLLTPKVFLLTPKVMEINLWI